MCLAWFDRIGGSWSWLKLSVGVTGEPIWFRSRYQCKHWARPWYPLQCRCHAAGLGQRGSSESDVCCSIVSPERRLSWRRPWLSTRDWEGSGCATSDTDVLYISIAVMIWRGPVFDSGSCSEQRRGSWSVLFVLGPDPGFDTASSISDLGAVFVTWHCDTLESNDW